ncbi:hypothetical protein ACFFGH_04825 [Lysobacter korlensis]|uniref:Uncharacterized protein n=1 Tax=Lysobacter korlensis TaxID=553636 RepID=A0ABV6RJL7_9GAMM
METRPALQLFDVLATIRLTEVAISTLTGAVPPRAASAAAAGRAYDALTAITMAFSVIAPGSR